MGWHPAATAGLEVSEHPAAILIHARPRYVAGPLRVTRALMTGLGLASPGSRSAGSLLLLCVFLLVFALLLPTLWLTGRAVKRTVPGSAARATMQARQDWYASAAIAWVICLVVGFMSAGAILVAL